MTDPSNELTDAQMDAIIEEQELARRAEVDAQILSENVQPAPACTWTPPKDDDEPWSTSCDNLFQFFDGGPAENQFSFCPYCGGKLVVNKVEDVADDR